MKWWADVLAQPADKGEQLKETEISRRLVAIIDQVDQLSILLRERGVPEVLYHNAHLKIKNGLSPAKMSQRWIEIKPHFGPEIITALRWAEWAVGSLEDTISNEDRQDIQAKITELEALLGDDSLPAALRQILRRQVTELRSALEDYVIYGIGPLEKAIKTITADIVSEQEALTSSANENPEETRKALDKLKSAMATTVTVIDKVAKTAGNIGKLWVISKEVLDKIPF
ncbi:hypothetical protein C7440_1046 [Pusillimonas noertemannii]|uniref:Uncharacterized protein n=2 Tax=Pusillimonas noertemannii TaxID=305977 RepID=A0A2U1CRW2_9BURK|nr:hypothetical protein C7440_1046 [Pusillimonas noertemannii]